LAGLWIASDRENVGAAGRACSRACIIQSGRERASASTPNLGDGAAMFWSASGLAELWIASERELVGAAGRACSRACVIQSGRERQHSKLGWRGGYVLECFRLGGALITPALHTWDLHLAPYPPDGSKSISISTASTSNSRYSSRGISMQPKVFRWLVDHWVSKRT